MISNVFLVDTKLMENSLLGVQARIAETLL